jgi:hypothetical protein
MPRYFFHLRDGEKTSEDEEGSIFSSLEEARSYAVKGARELLAESVKNDGKPPPDAVIIVDSHGEEVLTVLTVDVLPEKIRRLLSKGT